MPLSSSNRTYPPLSHCYNFFRGCVSEMFVTSYSVTYCIYVTGKPRICFYYHIELSYILQPPKYLFLFVNRFRYINNNITKDICPIPMDTTVRLGPLKLSLHATKIDHHGPSIDSGHYTASINCCKDILLQRSQNYGVTDKNCSTAYIVLYKWNDT